ncbi:MAG: hypothetical protein LBS91_02565, partial [Clostridiales Family XIII bacterium]|jgi:hypothetical protein|nr:hypothetical protein [Clostridiales Family XIII bacterium]
MIDVVNGSLPLIERIEVWHDGSPVTDRIVLESVGETADLRLVGLTAQGEAVDVTGMDNAAFTVASGTSATIEGGQATAVSEGESMILAAFDLGGGFGLYDAAPIAVAIKEGGSGDGEDKGGEAEGNGLGSGAGDGSLGSDASSGAANIAAGAGIGADSGNTGGGSGKSDAAVSDSGTAVPGGNSAKGGFPWGIILVAAIACAGALWLVWRKRRRSANGAGADAANGDRLRQ